MKCPKCGDTENIKFFVRHQKSSEDDEGTNANCLTILHANPECGFNESRLLEDCLDLVFPDWSEIVELQNKLNEVEQNMQTMNGLANMFGDMMPNEVIETDGKVIEDNELPTVQESEDIEEYSCDECLYRENCDLNTVPMSDECKVYIEMQEMGDTDMQNRFNCAGEATESDCIESENND